MSDASAAPVQLRLADRTSPLALLRVFRPFWIVLPFAVVIAIWWAAKAALDLNEKVLASPLQVAIAAYNLAIHGVLADYAATSLRMIGVAALISVLAGVPLGFAIGSNRVVARALEGTLRFLQGISGVAWLPLAIIWFGFSDTTKGVVVVYTLIVPIIVNTVVGVRAVPENYVLVLQSLGASRLRIMWDVYLPGALPSIVVGLRLGMGYGWRALIAAEMLVRRGGLGDLIFGARTFSQIDRIMVGMILIGVLYVIVDRLLVAPIESLTLARWGVLRK